MTMGDRIREARLAAGMTQQELASRVCLCVATISKLEKNQTTPRVEAVQNLATILECTSAHLLYGRLGILARVFGHWPMLELARPRGVDAKTIAVPQTTYSEEEDE